MDAGRVTVAWSVSDEGGAERLRWEERNGPRVVRPATRGFGSRLIETGLAFELQGKAELRYEPDGVVCVVEAPLHAVRAAGEENA